MQRDAALLQSNEVKKHPRSLELEFRVLEMVNGCLLYAESDVFNGKWWEAWTEKIALTGRSKSKETLFHSSFAEVSAKKTFTESSQKELPYCWISTMTDSWAADAQLRLENFFFFFFKWQEKTAILLKK